MNPNPSVQPGRADRDRHGRVRSVFVTGTDTEVGKTRVSTALLRALVADGVKAVGMKPVASGCERIDGDWRNEDALALIGASATALPYADVNPWALPAAIAPHAAAAGMGVELAFAPIESAFLRLRESADAVVVEGAGGWAVPLSDTLMQAAVPQRLHLPVILVVGLRLGCINHALLSARAIVADGCELLGWIGNRIDPRMAAVSATEAALHRLLPVPCLGTLDYSTDGATKCEALAAAVLRLRDGS